MEPICKFIDVYSIFLRICWLKSIFHCSTVYEHSRGGLTDILPSSLAIPLSGGISGSIGWFISFPLDCIKANIQGGDINIKSHSSFNVAKDILRTRGVAGLYSGIVPSISRAFLVSASRFSVYEFVYWMLSSECNGIEDTKS